MNTDAVTLAATTAGQDRRGMKVVKNIIEDILATNKTVITITHDMEFTVDNFERVIVMSEGKKLADNIPKEIFWDLELLQKAQLQQPYVSRVARKVNLPSDPINIQQLANFVEKNY